MPRPCATTSAARDLYESLAEVYSIIVTLDAVEKAYLRDSITDEEYTQACQRLLNQYKSNLQDSAVSGAFGDLESFMREWNVSKTLGHARRHLIYASWSVQELVKGLGLVYPSRSSSRPASTRVRESKRRQMQGL